MSDGASSLRRKIASARELKSVARTMKALAASNLGQYEKSAEALDEYYRAIRLGLAICFRESSASSHPPVLFPPGLAIGAVVFGTDQGLVGRFNETIAAYATAVLAKLPRRAAGIDPANVSLWTVGDHVSALLTEAGLPLEGVFPVPSSVDSIASLITAILVSCEASRHEIGELYLFHNRRLPGGAYEPAMQRLLPLDEMWLQGLAEVAWPSRALPEIVGDKAATMRSLIREYLFVSLFRACAESLASENGSRLAAMRRAERNIDDLLVQLNGVFHRLRQSAIDAELFDIVAGFEAMRIR